MRRRAAIGASAVLVLTLAACGGSDDAASVPSTVDPSSVTSASTGGALPPADALDLEELYRDALADLGLRLTDRGGLIDRSDGGYEPSPTGTHLALYVEPVGERTPAEYVDGIASVAIVFGDVFERWPDLETYDVCQEPVEEASPSENDPYYDESEPLPVTQIELTREQAAAFDWSSVTVADLVRAWKADPPGLGLRVSSSLTRDPAWTAVAGGWGQQG